MGVGARFVIVITCTILVLMLLAVVALLILRAERASPADALFPAIPSESGAWAVHFCPREDCMSFLNAELNASTTASCAFYSLTIKPTGTLLADDGAAVYVDEDTGPWSYAAAVPVRGSGLMHHKFCVLDHDVITTGSFNPTMDANIKDDNNLFIIQSSALHANYAAEIAVLGGKRTTTPFPRVMHDGFLMENYFCPRDDCEGHVVSALRAANASVLFMTYTFTSDPIEDTLIALDRQGVPVTGIIEKFQSANKQTYKKLAGAGIDVRYDANPGLMHHKVFLIDNRTVIFGSFNPTKAATTINEENVLIVHSENVTAPFIREWERVWEAAK